MRPTIILLTFFLFLLGTTISAHAENLHIHAIGWNGEHWLIGGRILPNGPTFLITWNGEKFLPVMTPAELKDVWVGNISWDGKKWIISELPATTLDKPKIYAYDGKTFRKIENTIEKSKRKFMKFVTKVTA